VKKEPPLSSQFAVACSNRELFARYMYAQAERIKIFRQRLSRRFGNEVTLEQAAFLWIDRGNAAAFRQRYEVRIEAED